MQPSSQEPARIGAPSQLIAHALSLAALTLVAFMSSTAAADEAPLFRFTEKPGTHAVGLKVVEQYDYSRNYRSTTDALGKPYSGERARPLQTLVWYPAQAGRGKAMTVGDYLNLWSTETSFGKPHLPTRAKEWRDGMKRTLAMSMWAVRDASALSGRFPVVVYAPGASQPSWDNADLCEYLASHGYVVIASPNFGAATRDMTIDMPGIQTQARDISFLIGYAHSLANADATKLAVVGYSWGGISNVFAAERDSRIDALVALDGSLRFSPGLVKAGGIDPRRFTIPLLSVAQGLWSPEDKDAILDRNPGHDGPDVLNAWTHGDVVLVNLLPLSHMEHGSMHQRNDDIWWNLLNVYGQKKAGFTREDGIAGYAWLARYTLNFLNAYLKEDATGAVFLKRTPAQNGAPPRFMDVKFRAAQPALPSFQAFRAQIGRDGFDHLDNVYADLLKRDSDFNLDPNLMSAWVQDLIDDGRAAEALALLKFMLRLAPQSSDTLTQLGNLYQQSGQKALAIEHYRRAVASSPMNAEARRQVELLEGRLPQR